MIVAIFKIIFFKPLYNALVFLIGVVPFHDIGIAVIILTIVVQGIIFPFRHKAVIAQRKMKEIEPEMKKIREKHRQDKQEQTKQIMALYKAHGVSPFSGFLMLLIQIPVFIALYQVFLSGSKLNPGDLYSFVGLPAMIQTKFLGLIDVSQTNAVLAVLAGLTQFFQMQLAMPKIKKADGGQGSFSENLSRSMSVQAKYIMPAFIFFIALRFPSAIALYWTAMNVFAIVHEAVVAHQAKKKLGNGREIKNYPKIN